MEAYCKIVDGVVDNYKTQVQDSLPNNFQGRFKQWKCSVTASRVGDILSSLPCARSGVNCAKSQITDGDVRMLKEVKEQRRKVAAPPKVFSIFQPKQAKEAPRKTVLKGSEEEVTRKVFRRTEEKSEDEGPKINAFKTAGEELRQQNAKKFGKDAVYSYGTVKKNLGSRGGGVHAKFTPPILRNE